MERLITVFTSLALTESKRRTKSLKKCQTGLKEEWKIPAKEESTEDWPVWQAEEGEGNGVLEM